MKRLYYIGRSNPWKQAISRGGLRWSGRAFIRMMHLCVRAWYTRMASLRTGIQLSANTCAWFGIIFFFSVWEWMFFYRGFCDFLLLLAYTYFMGVDRYRLWQKCTCIGSLGRQQSSIKHRIRFAPVIWKRRKSRGDYREGRGFSLDRDIWPKPGRFMVTNIGIRRQAAAALRNELYIGEASVGWLLFLPRNAIGFLCSLYFVLLPQKLKIGCWNESKQSEIL